MKDFFKTDAETGYIVLGAIGVLAIGLVWAINPAPKSNGPDLRQQRIDQQRELLELNTSLDAQKKEAEVAEARYKAGCLVVVSQANRNRFTSLTKGKAVIDASRNVPLSDGAVVCDAFGFTAEIVNGTVQNMAWTGNQQVVSAAMSKVQATYTIPGQ